MPRAKQKRINITLERDAENVGLYIKVPKDFEDYFAKLSKGEVETSGTWYHKDDTGAKFHKLTDQYQKISDSLNRDYPCFNSYGNGLVESTRSDSINIAPLRTVGASKGIRIHSSRFDEMNAVDFELYIRRLAGIAKKLWDGFIGTKKVKATIAFEVK